MSSAANISPWIILALTEAPKAVALIQALRSFRKEYPQLTDEDVQIIVADVTARSNAGFDSALAQIAADQAAHPPV
jgi:hypothetical protein